MTVAEAQQRIDSQEFASWLAYARINPFGEERADLRSAMVAVTIANANRGKGQPAFKIDDFMLTFDRVEKAQTPEEMFERLSAIAESHNRKLKLKAKG